VNDNWEWSSFVVGIFFGLVLILTILTLMIIYVYMTAPPAFIPPDPPQQHPQHQELIHYTCALCGRLIIPGHPQFGGEWISGNWYCDDCIKKYRLGERAGEGRSFYQWVGALIRTTYLPSPAGGVEG